jgi:hypothetical protein
MVPWHPVVIGIVAASRHRVASGLPIVLAVVFAALSVAVVADLAGSSLSYAGTSTGTAILDVTAGLGLIAAGAFLWWTHQRGLIGVLAARSPADIAHGSGLRGLIDRVEALDGRVDIDSPAGGGTRTSVELPVVPSPAVAMGVVATGVAAEPDGENRNQGRSKKRTGHDAGGIENSYGRSHRVPERSPR